ncbi:MAG: hypothetical protein LBQ54_00600 [Planctomycetaceae bacterium]|nr:hypothetical protein [Planctomycetaceae bacterium]
MPSAGNARALHSRPRVAAGGLSPDTFGVVASNRKSFQPLSCGWHRLEKSFQRKPKAIRAATSVRCPFALLTGVRERNKREYWRNEKEKQLERFSIGSEPNGVSVNKCDPTCYVGAGLPGCNVRTLRIRYYC